MQLHVWSRREVLSCRCADGCSPPFCAWLSLSQGDMQKRILTGPSDCSTVMYGASLKKDRI